MLDTVSIVVRKKAMEKSALKEGKAEDEHGAGIVSPVISPYTPPREARHPPAVVNTIIIESRSYHPSSTCVIVKLNSPTCVPIFFSLNHTASSMSFVMLS